jgi:crotonobetaine/carnitine-CoA ligase
MLDRLHLAPHAVARWAAETPDTVALQPVGGAAITYAELHADALRWAAGFAALGVGAGSHVATMLPNRPDAHRTMLALGWLRAIEVPLNTAFTGRILAYSLAHADVTTLVVASEYLDAVAAVADDLPELHTVVVLGAAEAPRGLRPRVVHQEELLAGGNGVVDEFVGPEYRDIHSLMFTSGTTGPSKAVITPWALMYQFWSWVPGGGARPGDGLYVPMGIFHNSGRGAFNYAMSAGARFVFRDKFSASAYWDDVREHDIRIAGLVGPMTAVLYSAEPSPDDADNPLEYVLLGPMIPEMEDFERRFGVQAVTGYGQTESGMAVTTGVDHGPPANCGRVRDAYPWPEVRVVNEWDEPLGPGEIGELVVRTREPWSINMGYYKMPEATVEAWRNGWFHTGDAFRYDDDGWFYFVDRLRDAIRRRGENISSFEVETMAAGYEGVVECAAIGVPAEMGEDEVLVAVIVNDPDAFDPAGFVEFLDGCMPKFMVPRYVRVLDDLPRTEASMRVRKHELRAEGVTPDTWDREA